MFIVISKFSALNCWRQRPDFIIKKKCVLKANYSQAVDSFLLADFANTCSLSLPLDTLVPKTNQRTCTGIVNSSISNVIPTVPCVVEIVPDIYLSSPEFVLLQLASSISIVDLIALISEFCGYYSLSESSESAFQKKTPLTTLENCRRFVDACPNYYGAQKFRTALEHAFANSASTRETALALILSLPTYLGGYHLEKPQLNYRVSLNRKAQESLHRDSLHVDLYWPNHKLGVEYDSNAYHLNPEQNTYDAKRINGLEYTGSTILTITTAQLNSCKEMDCIASMIGRYTGKRVRIKRSDFLERQRRLRATLLGEKRFLKYPAF